MLPPTKENSMHFIKTLKIKLPYDPVIPLLSISAEELNAGSQRDI